MGLPSWGSVGLTVVNNMGEEIGETIGEADGEGVVEGNVDRRDKWGWAARNSSLVRRSLSRVREVLSCQKRVPGLRMRRGSSSSLL